jgi:hypothetical protein
MDGEGGAAEASLQSKPTHPALISDFSASFRGPALLDHGCARAALNQESKMTSRTKHGATEIGFDMWLKEVDRLCMSRLGVSLHDLPDMLTRDAYDSGAKPKDFFNETVLEQVREDFGDDAVGSIEFE